MKCPTYNYFFETISHHLRMMILCELEKKPMSVSEICDSLNEEQSKVSHNLKKLAECHIVEVKPKGKKRIYSLNKDTTIPLMDIVKKHVEKYCCDSCKMHKKVKK